MLNNSELSDLASALFLVKKCGGWRNFHRTLPVHILERVCNRFLFYFVVFSMAWDKWCITCSKYSDNRAQCKAQNTRSNKGRLGRVVGSLLSDCLDQFAFDIWYHIYLEDIGFFLNWQTLCSWLSSDLKFGAYIWLVVLLIVHEVHEEIHHIGYSLIIINNQWLINSTTHQSPIDYFLAVVIYVFNVSFINIMSGL